MSAENKTSNEDVVCLGVCAALCPRMAVCVCVCVSYCVCVCVRVCFASVCLAPCLSICFRFCELDMDTQRDTFMCTHAHKPFITCPRPWIIISVWFKVKEMQQVNWSLRGQRSLITLFFRNRLERWSNCLFCDSEDRDISLIHLWHACHHIPSDPCHFLLSNRKLSSWLISAHIVAQNTPVAATETLLHHVDGMVVCFQWVQ